MSASAINVVGIVDCILHIYHQSGEKGDAEILVPQETSTLLKASRIFFVSSTAFICVLNSEVIKIPKDTAN